MRDIDMWLREFIASTPEFQFWGWNLATGAFIVTVALTLFQLHGLIQQARAVWKERKNADVSPVMFFTFFTYFLVFLSYSVSAAHRNGGGIVNTLILLWPQLFILAALVKFKPLNRSAILVAIGGIVLVAVSALTSYQMVCYYIAAVAMFGGLVLQALETIERKSVKGVALSFPLTFAIVTAAWVVYGIAIGDFLIGGIAFDYTSVYAWMVILWFAY